MRELSPSGMVALLFGGLCLAFTGCKPPEVAAPPEVPRSSLVLKEQHLYRPGQAAPFTGTVVEYYSPGRLQSRSWVSNGLLHGVSEGWYTNGTMQVQEYFVAGKSHGVRTKWYPNGTKLSEAAIAEGKLNGTFRRWFENGMLAEQIELRDDQPAGLSVAYYPSGCLKVRARVENGKVFDKETFADGEVKTPPVVTAAAPGTPKS